MYNGLRRRYHGRRNHLSGRFRTESQRIHRYGCRWMNGSNQTELSLQLFIFFTYRVVKFTGDVCNFACGVGNPQIGYSSIKKKIEVLSRGSDLSYSEILQILVIHQRLAEDVRMRGDDSSIPVGQMFASCQKTDFAVVLLV